MKKTTKLIMDTCREWQKVMSCNGECHYSCPLKCLLKSDVEGLSPREAVKRYFHEAISKDKGRQILAERAFQGFVRAYCDNLVSEMADKIEDYKSLERLMQAELDNR